MKKITYLVMLIVIQGYSQALTEENFDYRLEKMALKAFSEFDTFSKYGLKWGMSAYEAEVYLKDIESTGGNQIRAKGKFFGKADAEFMLYFENEKLTKIIALFDFKQNLTPFEIEKFYLKSVNEINEELNPANRVKSEHIRDFFNSNARDTWVYNRGKSGVSIGMQKSSKNGSPPLLIFTFTGISGSDVILLTKPPYYIKQLGPQAIGVFSRKVGNPEVSFILMK
jgi:hypothetical protein